MSLLFVSSLPWILALYNLALYGPWTLGIHPQAHIHTHTHTLMTELLYWWKILLLRSSRSAFCHITTNLRVDKMLCHLYMWCVQYFSCLYFFIISNNSTQKWMDDWNCYGKCMLVFDKCCCPEICELYAGIFLATASCKTLFKTRQSWKCARGFHVVTR